MARQFLCRLYFVRQPDGNVRVTYDCPQNEPTEGVDLTGPQPIDAPIVQTPQAHARWRFETVRPQGPYMMGVPGKRYEGEDPIVEIDIPEEPANAVLVAELESDKNGR